MHICQLDKQNTNKNTSGIRWHMHSDICLHICIYDDIHAYRPRYVLIYMHVCPIYACIYAYITTNMDICLRRSYIYAYMHPSMPRRTGRSPIARTKLIRGQLQRRWHYFAIDAYALEVRPRNYELPHNPQRYSLMAGGVSRKNIDAQGAIA